MDVSIVIPTYNGRKWLEISLPSIFRQDYTGAYEILLVENSSSDDTSKYVQKTFPEVRILPMPRNLGYAEGSNQGVGCAQGRYIVILNNDVQMDENWLSTLVEAADKHPEFQLLASLDQHRIVRDFNIYLEVVGSNTATLGMEIATSLFASGACMLIRREWIRRLGKLFEPYFYYEDAELSLRSVLLGGNIGYVPSSRYQHFSELELNVRTAETVREKHLHLARFSSRTKIKSIYTLFSLRSFLKLLLVHFFYVAIICLFRRDRSRLNLEMIRGTIEGISEIGTCAAMHAEFQKRKKHPDDVVFRKLIFSRSSFLQKSVWRILVS